MSRFGSAFLVSLGILFFQTPVNAIDDSTLTQLLKREIIGPHVAMAEVQSFTETRVPTMPEVKSLKEWEEIADQLRRDMLDRVVFRGEAARWREAKAKVEWLETIKGGPGYQIKKLRFEALPGLWIPALLYEPTKLSGKVPVVMNVNGHDRANGKAAKYKQIRCINQAKRGMIALNVEWLGMGQLQGPGYVHYAMNQLDLCGTSGLAPFYLSMQRGLDVLLAHKNADPKRVAVAGLSGGGWQTIFISALDTRVTLSNPVAGYSSFLTRIRHLKDLGDSEQTPNDMATVADYSHMTAMMAPRATLLTFNQKDNCCFEAPYALPPLLDAAKPIFKLFDQSKRLRSHVNEVPGTHNFEQDNREALYRMFRDHFYEGSDNFDPGEIASDDEVKMKEQLKIPVPDENETFNSLALQLAKSLPRNASLPKDKASAETWRKTRREKLASLTKYSHQQCVEKKVKSLEFDGVRSTFWRLRIGDTWTVPAVELIPPKANGTTIVVDDRGRAATSASVLNLLKNHQRVIAVDPFYFGESKIQQKDFLFALLVAAVGQRPLGIQASQLAATARWVQAKHPNESITLLANGPRSSTFALVAAGIETKAVAAVELHGALGSLKEMIEKNQNVQQTPEMFCFGLLEDFDILQLAALATPRPVTFNDPSDRAREELKPLDLLYERLGVDHKPIH